ncbi:MAG TPA: DUF3667 domain-containing protein [Ohtaekwangia sp.]
MICKNCGATIDTKFCPDCGQKAETHRITIGHLAHEFFHVMTHADKGILFLIKELIRRPGFVVKEFLEGRRKKYFNPISFIVITSALGAIASFKSGYYSALGRVQTGQASEASEIAASNSKLLGLFLIVPIYSLLSWLFFWRPRYNFAEHVVLQSYAIGMLYIAQSLIFVPLYLLFPETVSMNNHILHLVFLIYMVVIYKQLFNNHILIALLKAIVIFVAFVAAFWFSIRGYLYLKHLLFAA